MWPLAILFLFGAVGAKADSAVHEQEHRAENTLSQAIGTDKVQVKIDPDGLSVGLGNISQLEVQASGFTMEDLPLWVVPGARPTGSIGNLRLRLSDFTLRSLHITELDADIPGCKYDFSQAKQKGYMDFAKTGVGTGSVVIDQNALRDYILHKYKEIKTCKVTVDRDVIIVEGRGEFVVATTDFMVVARIGVTQGTKLNLVGAHIYFGLEKADEITAHALLKILNPVVDLNKDLGLGDAVSVNTVVLRNGKVTALGQSRLPTKASVASASNFGSESKSK